MTTLSLTAVFGIMTLVPLVAGVALFALHLAGYATRRLATALAIVAAVVPAVCVALLVPAISPEDPIMVRPFGAGAGFTEWIAPAFRIDTLAMYAGLGCAFLVLPLVFWLTFAQRAAPDEDATPDAEDAAADAQHAPAAVPDASDAEETDDITTPVSAQRSGWRAFIGADDQLAPAAVRSLAFTGVLSAALLAAIFADSFVLAGVAWLAVVLAGWAIGEAASDGEHLDRLGLILAVIGPLAWLIVLIVVGHNANGMRFLQLMGTQPLNVAESIIMAVALALAGGAYPAMAWLRRRTAFASPAGIGALVLSALPLTIYLGARTYALAADGLARWPTIGAAPTGANAPPPITAGIAFCLLGAVTVAVAGLLAIGRRDARALIALLAAAQVGWALVALGAGTSVSAVGVVLLLSTTVLGLGAMIASLVAGSAITTDVEPDADGPRPAGAPVRPVSLAAWSIGAATLIGVPLFAGFTGRQLTSAGLLQAGGLNVPLGALCWAGDALLALALLRATAPALADLQGDAQDAQMEVEDDEDEDAIHDTELTDDESDLDDQDDADIQRVGPRRRWWSARELPAAIVAVIALVMAIFPGYALGLYAGAAAHALLGAGSIPGALHGDALGYTVGGAQWSSGIVWLAAVLLGAIVLALQPAGSSRVLLPVVGAVDGEEAAAAEESTTLSEPEDAWSDLAGAFTSEVALPGRQWLLDGIDDGAEDQDASDDDATDDANEEKAVQDSEGVAVATRTDTQADARTEEVARGDE